MKTVPCHVFVSGGFLQILSHIILAVSNDNQLLTSHSTPDVSFHDTSDVLVASTLSPLTLYPLVIVAASTSGVLSTTASSKVMIKPL